MRRRYRRPPVIDPRAPATSDEELLNAENVLEVQDPGLADLMADYIDAVRERYERMSAPDGARRP